jgi:acetyltransferase-like isoleucine patch superfamily enzyme
MDYIAHYGFFGFLRLLIEKCITWLRLPSAKIIRTPFEWRGRKYTQIDSGFTTGRYCRIEAHSDVDRVVLRIGKNCQINDSVHIAAANDVVIGNDVLIASRVFITDLNHGGYKGNLHSHPSTICKERALQSSYVHIGDNVWLGEGVVVLPGVSIGECSIIGANSVVSHNIPANSIAVGSPAKVIKAFDFELSEWVSING